MVELSRRGMNGALLGGALALGLAPIARAFAAVPPPAKLSAADKTDVARIEAYMTGMKTLSANFVQVTDQGGIARGQVYLSRPGRMRFQYDPPTPILMIADGTFLIYYDKQLKQSSFIPLGRTPVSYLVREEVSLTDKLIITRFERQAQTLNITLVEERDPDQGSLTLVFDDKPLRLVQWVVVDQQKVSTRVSLVNTELGRALEDRLFEFKDPKMFGEHAND